MVKYNLVIKKEIEEKKGFFGFRGIWTQIAQFLALFYLIKCCGNFAQRATFIQKGALGVAQACPSSNIGLKCPH